MPGFPITDPGSPAGRAYVRNNSPQQAHIEALRRFLISKGYDMLPHQGGHMGDLLRSALADWHQGVGKRNPHAWDQQILRSQAKNNAAHDPSRMGPHGADGNIQARAKYNLAHDPNRNGPHGPDVPKTPAQNKAAGMDMKGGQHPDPKGPAPHMGRSPANHGGGGGGGGNFLGMMTNLVGQSGVNHNIPLSLADQIAGPDSAAAQAAQSEIDQLPSAKKAALKNIADWYGQVQGSEKTAAGRDQTIANQGAAADTSNVKGIMDSLGGSAMAGAGSIGAVGANDANTMRALGANDAQLASDLGPIFDLVKADASKQTQHQFDEGKITLNNNLAAAKGQESADRANAIMQILQANNSGRQQNFANQSGLLNTLASLQISGANAASNAQYKQIENALHMSEIQKNQQKAGGGLEAMSPQQRADFVQKIVGGLVDPNTHKLMNGMTWPAALRAARNYVRSAGLNPMNKQIENVFIGPALSQAGITAQGGGYWPAIYQP